MRIVWTRRAQRDLFEIGHFIARDNIVTARKWIEKLRNKARSAAHIPRSGRKVPEFGREDIREVFLKSYRIEALNTRSSA